MNDYFDRLIISQFFIADERKVIYCYLSVTKINYLDNSAALAIVYAKAQSLLTRGSDSWRGRAAASLV